MEKKRIVVGQIMHESSSLAKDLTEIDNFKRTLIWYQGDDVFRLSEMGMKDYLTGIIDKGIELGLDIKPCFCTFASPSGIISEACFEELIRRFFDNIPDGNPIDGFCIALHGAGVSENVKDIEGAIIERIRELYGQDIPIVVTLDPHANITEKMIQKVTLLIPSKLYPHTDTYETGMLAIDLLDKMLKGEIHPKMSVKKIPILIPITKGCTSETPMKSVLEKCDSAACEGDILYCIFVHGFPYSNIDECGAAVVTISENNFDKAVAISNDIAGFVLENKNMFISDCLSVKEGVDLAENILHSVGGPVIINEASDNPGAGTPGDGTYLLSELLKRDIPHTCSGAIIDSEVVRLAVKAGVGSKIDLSIGGKTDDMHGNPIFITDVYVKAICDGKYTLKSPMTFGQPVNFGTSVRLQKGNIDIIVATNTFQIMDDGIFLLLGIDIKNYNIVAVKSAQHFKAYFDKLSTKIITVDPPGISTGNLEILSLNNIARPVIPFDKITK